MPFDVRPKYLQAFTRSFTYVFYHSKSVISDENKILFSYIIAYKVLLCRNILVNQFFTSSLADVRVQIFFTNTLRIASRTPSITIIKRQTPSECLTTLRIKSLPDIRLFIHTRHKAVLVIEYIY